MSEILYKLRNGLTVKKIRNTRSMFVIVTKNEEIDRLFAADRIRERAGIICDTVINLITVRNAQNPLQYTGGALGPGFDVVGYKRRPEFFL